MARLPNKSTTISIDNKPRTHTCLQQFTSRYGAYRLTSRIATYTPNRNARRLYSQADWKQVRQSRYWRGRIVYCHQYDAPSKQIMPRSGYLHHSTRATRALTVDSWDDHSTWATTAYVVIVVVIALVVAVFVVVVLVVVIVVAVVPTNVLPLKQLLILYPSPCGESYVQSSSPSDTTTALTTYIFAGRCLQEIVTLYCFSRTYCMLIEDLQNLYSRPTTYVQHILFLYWNLTTILWSFRAGHEAASMDKKYVAIRLVVVRYQYEKAV